MKTDDSNVGVLPKRKTNFKRDIAALQQMTNKQLRAKYAETFGEETQANNKAWLVKRIAWRIQSMAEGDLTERARLQAEELANDADVRMTPPKTATSSKQPAPAAKSNNRLPVPGAQITRDYKGRTYCVEVLENGFECDGVIYKSLSAAAKAISGQHCSGYLFFRLGKQGGAK
jgi:Protein of unknown function (DUF2924)